MFIAQSPVWTGFGHVNLRQLYSINLAFSRPQGLMGKITRHQALSVTWETVAAGPGCPPAMALSPGTCHDDRRAPHLPGTDWTLFPEPVFWPQCCGEAQAVVFVSRLLGPVPYAAWSEVKPQSRLARGPVLLASATHLCTPSYSCHITPHLSLLFRKESALLNVCRIKKKKIHEAIWNIWGLFIPKLKVWAWFDLI